MNYYNPVQPNIQANIQPIPQIDYKKISEQFLNFYYFNFGNSGFVDNLDFFSEKCNCNVNGESYNGAYKLLVKYAKLNFHRVQISALASSYYTLNNNLIICSVMKGKPVNMSNQLITDTEYIFSENFVINILDNNLKINNYTCFITS